MKVYLDIPGSVDTVAVKRLLASAGFEVLEAQPQPLLPPSYCGLPLCEQRRVLEQPEWRVTFNANYTRLLEAELVVVDSMAPLTMGYAIGEGKPVCLFYTGYIALMYNLLEPEDIVTTEQELLEWALARQSDLELTAALSAENKYEVPSQWHDFAARV